MSNFEYQLPKAAQHDTLPGNRQIYFTSVPFPKNIGIVFRNESERASSHPLRMQPLWSIEACSASSAVLKRYPGLAAAGIVAPLPVLAEVKGRRYPWGGRNDGC